MSIGRCTYVIFDGDNDMWAWGYMKGWNALANIDFAFDDAHDLRDISERSSEASVKMALQHRFAASRAAVVVVGEHTKNLYKFVRWEIETALDLRLPIVVANLNDRRSIDVDRCPPLLRDEYAVHVSFKMAIVKHALDRFPAQHSSRGTNRFPLSYPDSLYAQLGL